MDKESVVLGCGCEVYGDEAEELKQRFRLLRLLIVSTALSMPLLWDLPPRFQFVLATVLQFGPGLYFLRNAIRGLKNRSLGMDLLVALSTTVIYVYSTVVTFTVTENIKLYYLCDGVLISLLLFGRYLESVAIYQSGEAVRGLLRLQPKTAIVLRDGIETEIDAAEIVSGDTILLRPGERIPADGKILEGNCQVDESLLTGESEPVQKGPGDSITGSTLNREGKVTYTATSVGEDSDRLNLRSFCPRTCGTDFRAVVFPARSRRLGKGCLNSLRCAGDRLPLCAGSRHARGFDDGFRTGGGVGDPLQRRLGH